MVDESRIIQSLELAKSTGKIKIGTNEATKAIERGIAKLVVVADDVNPKEVIAHLPSLCSEKKVPLARIKSKQELGRASGVKVPAAAVAVIESGEAKKIIDEIAKG